MSNTVYGLVRVSVFALTMLMYSMDAHAADSSINLSVADIPIDLPIASRSDAGVEATDAVSGSGSESIYEAQGQLMRGSQGVTGRCQV